MAFCPLCGKKIPDNGICSCGKKLDENGNIVSNVSEAAPQAPVQQAAAQVQQAQAPVQQAAVKTQEAVVQTQAQAQQAAAQVQQTAQAQPQQPQAPVQPAAPKAPAGPSVFGEAIRLFTLAFKNPLGAKQEVLEDKVPIGSPMILGGVYFFVVWWALTLLLVGSCSIKFLPAWGFGALGGLFFYGIRCGAAFLISVFSKNPNAKFVKTVAAMFVDTVLLDCILIVMMLFQFATVYFAVFFLLIYLGLIFYQNTELFRKLSGTSGEASVKIFWFNVVVIIMYAFLIMIAYIIFNNMPASASKYYSSISSLFDW